MQRINILITGTPGTGKTTLSEMVAASRNMIHIDVSKLVKEKHLHDGYLEEFDSYELNEDKVCDELEPIMGEGHVVVDYHSSDFFPERWFHLVVVLRTNNTILYDRLEKRGYKANKITENIECEIMEVVLQEALDSYKSEVIMVLDSNTVEDMENNVLKIQEWIDNHLGQ
jgi:adenylate kinase